MEPKYGEYWYIKCHFTGAKTVLVKVTGIYHYYIVVNKVDNNAAIAINRNGSFQHFSVDWIKKWEPNLFWKFLGY